jgi:transcriptional regulator with GAF, ATPase, and Fis domain
LLADDTFGATFFARLPEWMAWFSAADAAAEMRKACVSIHRRNGELLVLELVLTPTSGGTVEGLMVDVTNRKNEALMLAERGAELEALQQVAAASIRYSDLESLLPRLLEISIAAVGAQGGIIWTCEVGSKELVLVAAKGVGAAFRERIEQIPFGQGFAGKVAVARTAAYVEELSVHPELMYEELRTERIHNYAAYPLLVGTRLLGVLSLFTKDDKAFNTSAYRLSAALAMQVSLSLEHAVSIQAVHERNDELERFNQFAVDRELRMIELKKRIRELEALLV